MTSPKSIDEMIQRLHALEEENAQLRNTLQYERWESIKTEERLTRSHNREREWKAIAERNGWKEPDGVNDAIIDRMPATRAWGIGATFGDPPIP